jgi:nucleotidyltransferase substrate binding protein (TIGR01987 family)
MDKINTDFLARCLGALERSYALLAKAQKDSVDYEMYRNSLVKSFEMTLEQSGKLLRKKLTPYLASKKAADALTFKDLFRQAGLRGLLDTDAIDRWLNYRDNRNDTTHDYGQNFAEQTLALLPDFMRDARQLKDILENG